MIRKSVVCNYKELMTALVNSLVVLVPPISTVLALPELMVS